MHLSVAETQDLAKNSVSFPRFEASNIGKYEHFSYEIMKKYLIRVNRANWFINLFSSNQVVFHFSQNPDVKNHDHA